MFNASSSLCSNDTIVTNHAPAPVVTLAAHSARRMRFTLAGYVFTYRRDENVSPTARVRIDMWREDPHTSERFWITVAVCAPRPHAARKVALALVAWVRSCDVMPRSSVKATAVAESFAMLREQLSRDVPGARGTVSARQV